MKALFATIAVVLIVAAPMGGGQAAPGPACAPASDHREQNESGASVSVTVEGLNQAMLVRIGPDTLPGTGERVVGYRIWVHEEGAVRIYETSSVECRLSAVNGRLYAVQAAPVFEDGSHGTPSAPVPVEPSLENDFLYLALGLAVVWLGVWAYAGILVRQQRRVTERYEALLKHTEPADGP